MRRLRLPGEHGRNRAIARQRNIQQEIVPRHAGNLQQLPMQRVIFDRALHRPRIAHEFRAVQYLDRFLSGQPGRDQLPPAGKTKHEMRLDEAERDVKIGGQKTAVDIDRRAGGGRSQMPM